MTRPRVLAGIIATAFCLMLTSSVRADSNHGDLLLEKLIFAERHNLTEFNEQLFDTNYLYTAHFENNNGKHLGFSMAAVHQGPKSEIVKPPATTSVTQNPEPTAMVVLGTGLAAAAAWARKLNRKRRD